MYSPYDASPQLAIWKGRRGVINTAVCGLLGLICGFALWTFTERTSVVPACTQYTQTHGLTYENFRGENHRRDSGVVCLFTGDGGKKSEVSLRDVVPYLTDQWVGVAMSLVWTVPVFTVLFAMLRVKIYHSRSGVTQ